MISSGLALQVRYVAGVQGDLLSLLSGDLFNLHNDEFFLCIGSIVHKSVW